ncbi:MAG: hypothetical protein K8R76_04880 [Candidatus Aegiribacteria sp.]|nr:hypothetical protein [Candidatus Aegiribacteria sp.]
MKPVLTKCVPVLLILFMMIGCDDPNESGIEDCKDFKDATVAYSGGDLNTEIEFYDDMCLSEFYYYFNTDTDPEADFLVRCHPTEFTVSKESAISPGLYDDLKYTGIPVISGVYYRLEFPFSVLENMPTVAPVTVGYWFYAMDGSDRMPDDGSETITAP